MKNKKTLFSIILVILITWVIAFIYEPKLPEMVPSHWNIEGEVDGYISKPWGIYLLPVISTAMSIFLFLLPAISPKGFKLDAAKKVYELIVLVMSVFMLGIMVLVFEAGLNKGVSMNQWMMVAMGLLFLILGNYLSKVPKNFFVGIRTPWTLASDEVWYKTHRLGSWTFVLAGVVLILGAVLQWSFSWLFGTVMAAALIPVIYSLIIYKQLEGFNESE